VNDSDLVRLVDSLEEKAESYVTLDEVTQAAAQDVAQAITAGLLLVDYRTRVDGTPITLCRLNRHHPLVVKLTSW
jgi:hypothetical protein